jgi:eukaryotic-like serine/threonine-protein kinase
VRKCPQCDASYDDAIAFCPADGTRTEVSHENTSPDPLIGTVMDGRYRIEQRIGEGGMGVVYKATHVMLSKPFALKVIRGDQAAADASIVERFMREARAASAIGHPNIVNINDFGETSDGSAYLAMEYLEGMTLAQAMQSEPIAFARALAIFIQIADALEAAHAQGIVHRDLKPENIFLMRQGKQLDFVKVLDFGIAKVKNAAAKLTRTGLVIGTPHYMSPEQAAGQPVDHRTDIYSLGVIMYQVLAGELPFAAESVMALMTMHMFDPAPSLREGGHAVPSALDAIVGRCLQKKPELRHGSMRELEADLRRVQLSPVSEPSPATALASLSLSASISGSAPPAAFTASSETLDEAALLSDNALDDEDMPVSVPKRRPVWLWAVAAGILVMLVLSLSVGSREERAADGDDPAAPGGKLAEAAADAGDALPSGLSAPAAQHSTEPAPRAKAAPAVAEPQPRAKVVVNEPRPQPIAAPAAAKASSVSSGSGSGKASNKSSGNSKPAAQRGESLIDPWH